jgi:hypothetical protein
MKGFDDHLDNYGNPGAEMEAQDPTPAIVITGADNIEFVRLLAVRGALWLETRGLKRRGRSARVLANEAMGTDIRTKAATYEAFNDWLVARGAQNRPLNKEA